MHDESLSCPIVLRKKGFKFLSTLLALSFSHAVTGIVQAIYINVREKNPYHMLVEQCRV